MLTIKFNSSSLLEEIKQSLIKLAVSTWISASEVSAGKGGGMMTGEEADDADESAVTGSAVDDRGGMAVETGSHVTELTKIPEDAGRELTNL